jgi:hypothetical protein
MAMQPFSFFLNVFRVCSAVNATMNQRHGLLALHTQGQTVTAIHHPLVRAFRDRGSQTPQDQEPSFHIILLLNHGMNARVHQFVAENPDTSILPMANQMELSASTPCDIRTKTMGEM